MNSKAPKLTRSIAHWILKGCGRCRGDMYPEQNGKVWRCLQCGYSPQDKNSPARYRLGRKPLGITVNNITDTLQNNKSIGAAADILGCSRGYIYQELKKQGKTPKEIIARR